MTRGLFSNLLGIPGYGKAETSWHVTLERSDLFWYELVVDPPDFHNTKQEIFKYLTGLRSKVEETLEKRFIYFYVSRRKVRFDTKRPPKYSLLRGDLVINLLIGGEERRQIRLQMPTINGKRCKPEVVVDDRFIYFNDASSITCAAVHDFLRLNHIVLGLSSEVHYVGITHNPAERTLSRKHRGYADSIYFAPTSENDIFLWINTFKVMSDTTTTDGGFRIVVPNSMTDEVPAGAEGLVIEHALMHYFDTKAQEQDKETSWPRFKNLLHLTLGAKNITSVSFHLECENPSEYDLLGSRKTTHAVSHSFLWQLSKGEPTIQRFASEEDVLQYRENTEGV